MYASAQSLDYLCLTKNCSFPNQKLASVHPVFPDEHESSCKLEVSLLEPVRTQIAQSQVPALTVVEALKTKKFTFGPKVNHCLTRLFGQVDFFGNLAVLLRRIHGFASPHYYGFALIENSLNYNNLKFI
jgi:hypothetical protein